MHALSRDDDSVFVERQAYSTPFSQCMGVYVENNVLPYILCAITGCLVFIDVCISVLVRVYVFLCIGLIRVEKQYDFID